MTDTPRTDAAYCAGLQALHPASGEGIFARQLERELATTNAAYDEARKDTINLTEKVIPNLRAELARCMRVMDDEEHEAVERPRKLEAELEQAKRDAERYRWLREARDDIWIRSRLEGDLECDLFGDDLDTAIDAAMEQGK